MANLNFAEQPLLINDVSPINTHEHKTFCSKCINYCLIPLDILIWPITRCMTASCWSSRRYYQYDLAIQLMGIYQTLIGALWASSFLSIIDEFHHSEDIKTVFLALYCATSYAVCNIIVVVMQRKQFFNEKISFYVGTLGEIVAFGVKSLAFKIMEQYFSLTFHAAVLYFCLCLAVSITMIYGLSWLRKQFCFAMKELDKQTAEMRQKIAEDVSNKINESINKIKNKNRYIGVEIYESDFMDALLNDDYDESADEHEEDQESFDDLVKEIDTDIFTITMGCIFVELIIYALTSQYVQLNDQEGSDSSEEHDELQNYISDIILTVSLLSLIVTIIFGIFSRIISFVQMKRDRVLYKIFKSLEIRSNSNNNLREIKLGDLEINENCCIAGCITFSYKSYKLSEHIVTFMIGFLGWAFGWTLVSGLYWTDKVEDRFYYSLVLTMLGILFYFFRSIKVKRKFERWKKSAKQTMDIKNAKVSSDSSDSDDNIFDNDVERREMEDELEYDLFEMKAKHHQTLYRISNLNFFSRKAYGLMVALPWELTYELVMEDMVVGVSNAVLLRFSVAFAATIILSYCGVQFVKIGSEIHHHSTSHATAQLLKGNYMKLKKFV